MRLYALFLLTPQDELALKGQSPSGMFAAIGRSSLFKSFGRALANAKASPEAPLPKKLVGQFTRLLQDRSAGGSDESKHLFVQALNGDVQSLALVERTPLWMYYRSAMSGPDDNRYRRAMLDHWVEVETAVLGALDGLPADDSAATATAIANDPSLRIYWTDPALARLGAAASADDALPASTAALFELLLAQVARLEAFERTDRPGCFAELLRGREEPKKGTRRTPIDIDSHSPGAALVGKTKQWFGVKTLEALQALDQRGLDPEVSITTLKDWSRGATFPSEAKFEPFMRSLLASRPMPPEDVDDMQLWYGVAQRLDALLRLARAGWGAAGLAQMLGAATAHEWSRQRYPQWVQYWRSTSSGQRGTNPLPN